MTQTVPRDRWEQRSGNRGSNSWPAQPPPTHEPDRDGQCRWVQNVVLEQVDLMIFAPPRAVSFTYGEKRYLVSLPNQPSQGCLSLL